MAQKKAKNGLKVAKSSKNIALKSTFLNVTKEKEVVLLKENISKVFNGSEACLKYDSIGMILH